MLIRLKLETDLLPHDSDGIVAAWMKALRAIMPAIIQDLLVEIEEYKNVGSSEYTNHVAKATKGIATGIDAFATIFLELREMLSPPPR
jgi:hypothetical protein